MGFGVNYYLGLFVEYAALLSEQTLISSRIKDVLIILLQSDLLFIVSLLFLHETWPRLLRPRRCYATVAQLPDLLGNCHALKEERFGTIGEFHVKRVRQESVKCVTYVMQILDNSLVVLR